MRTMILMLLVILLSPGYAQAHEADHGGFLSGLSHPVLGFDHLLAMVAVGILSVQMGGRAIWIVPATFVGMMLVGGIMGINNIPFLSVEAGIAISVFALGIALAAEKKLPVMLAMLFVGFFALFHGHAHRTEMPFLAEPTFYATGFLLGTAGIHIAGVLIGLSSEKWKHGPQLLRSVGSGIAGIGLHLFWMLTFSMILLKLTPMG